MKLRQKATFEGATEFPCDMLRYDRCYPATTEDGAEIFESIKADKTRRVVVERLTDTALFAKDWTVGRWHSFGWNLLSTEDTKL